MPHPTPDDCCVACHAACSFFGSRDAFDYFRCSRCHTLQLSPFPTPERLRELYAREYASAGHYSEDPEGSFIANEPFYRTVRQIIQSATNPLGKILDVGCGWGGFGEALKGKNYVGIDYSSDAVRFCQSRGLDVRQGGLESLEEESFTYAVCLSVFEHLVEYDRFLEDIRRVLRPEGTLVILIPTAAFAYRMGRFYQILTSAKTLPELHQTFCPPWHTVLFSVVGARKILERNAFKVRGVFPSPSGNGKGLIGIIKRAATLIGRAGFYLYGEDWPLLISHIFVCDKTS